MAVGHTTNYNLIKPTGADPVLVSDLNTNADIIDAALYAKPDTDDTAGDGDTRKTWSADKLVGEFAGKLSNNTIDDTAGDGDTNKVWSADKVHDQLGLKFDKSNVATVAETQAMISDYYGG